TDDRAAELVLSLTQKEHAALLARAGAAGVDVRRYVIDRALEDAPRIDPATQFEAVDSLMRIGTLLHRLVDISRSTGVVPEEVLGVIDRVERALEHRLTA
ncbi:MAG TPA: hypothetical protein PK264_19335, partial [Hyphomicrobiaceae bacterium]|nr:hypothetical protein [Hyphomicrobiaceae bacterium]